MNSSHSSPFLSHLTDSTPLEEEEPVVDVQEIAKSKADEAIRISVAEAAVSETEEARKAAEKALEAPGSAPASASADVVMRDAGHGDPSTVDHPILPEERPTTTPLASSLQLHHSEVPVTYDAGKTTPEDAFAEIVTPSSRGSTGTSISDDSAADLAFLKTMAVGFQDMQKRYGTC